MEHELREVEDADELETLNPPPPVVGGYAEEEKQALRQSLYFITKEMVGDAAPVRLQLIECIRLIATHDYPEK